MSTRHTSAPCSLEAWPGGERLPLWHKWLPKEFRPSGCAPQALPQAPSGSQSSCPINPPTTFLKGDSWLHRAEGLTYRRRLQLVWSHNAFMIESNIYTNRYPASSSWWPPSSDVRDLVSGYAAPYCWHFRYTAQPRKLPVSCPNPTHNVLCNNALRSLYLTAIWLALIGVSFVHCFLASCTQRSFQRDFTRMAWSDPVILVPKNIYMTLLLAFWSYVGPAL
jgi:hypothetical protein